MKRFLFISIFVLFAFLIKAQPIKVMLVTGGHSFDTVEFFQMFDELEGIEYTHFEQPKANKELVKNLAKDFDVIVFYDMWKKISKDEKKAYLKLTKQGMPFLFLHHSIASYQNWDEFEKIIGGKYFEKSKRVPEELHSTYEHDVWVYSKVVKYTPVTSGFKELRFFDEIYGNVQVSEQVTPLLRTRHPKSMEFIAWHNVYNNSNIVYLQPGHDKRTYIEEDYQKLVIQAITYLAISK
jgi:type 1 glutamine amidotransferase